MPLPASIRPLAIAAIASRKDGPPALAKAIAGKQLDPDTAKLVLRTVRAAPQPSDELIAAVQSAGGLSEAAWKLTPELVAEFVKEVPAKGDPVRGEAIYRQSANQCLKCHAIGGAGGIVGPDMVSLGATAQIDYLLEVAHRPGSQGQGELPLQGRARFRTARSPAASSSAIRHRISCSAMPKTAW